MSAALKPEATDGQLIYKLIPEVMKEIGAVEKNRKNEQQKYSFRGIEDFYQAAHPAFVKHGIFCAPEVLDREATSFEKLNDFGKITIWRHVTLRVRHRFYAGDGSFVDVTTFGEGLDNSDKASNKAMSGAMKYALIELFSVPTQDVEDSDRTSPETGASGKPVAVVAAPKTFTRPSQVKETEAAAPNWAGSSNPAPSREPGSDDGEYEKIDLPRSRALHRAFREAIRNAEAQKQAEAFLRDWLKHQGYVDGEGKGTTKTIPMATFEQVKAKAVQFAKEMPV